MEPPRADAAWKKTRIFIKLISYGSKSWKSHEDENRGVVDCGFKLEISREINSSRWMEVIFRCRIGCRFKVWKLLCIIFSFFEMSNFRFSHPRKQGNPQYCHSKNEDRKKYRLESYQNTALTNKSSLPISCFFLYGGIGIFLVI